MPSSFSLRSPAKLNLSLRILKKRPDGFHELETLFERIGLYDTLHFKKTDGRLTLVCRTPGVPSGPDNLAYKAAALLKEKYRVRAGVEIRLEKKIPAGAGLGGGSGNAATVLLGLNKLWKLRLKRHQLIKLGAQLGSDVPFFLMETAFAVGEGRGEKLRAVNLKGRQLWHCLIKPSFSISTKEAYQGLSADKLTPQKGDVKMLVQFLKTREWKGLAPRLSNTLELALNKRLTAILKIKKSLQDCGAEGSLMSGSGSSVFGIFKTRAAAAKAAAILGRKNKTWKVFTVSTA